MQVMQAITQGVILAAGNGKRLKPFTLNRSKAMAPILGKPIVARVLDTLLVNGIQDIAIVVSPTDQEIQDYFSSGVTGYSGCKITFVYQLEKLGMAHALGCAKAFIHGPFIMTACDSLVKAEHITELLTTHVVTEASVTLSLKKVKDEEIAKRAIVQFDDAGKVVKIVEKPTLEEAPSRMGSLPLYVFNQEIMEIIPTIQLSKRGEYEIQDGIQMLIQKYGFASGVITDYRVELTDVNDLLAINLKFLTAEAPEGLVDSPVPQSTRLIQPVKIDKEVAVGERAVIGPCVYLESGSTVGDGAVVDHALVLRGSSVGAGEHKAQVVLL